MEVEEQLLNYTLHFAFCSFLLMCILLWFRRKYGDRARLYLIGVCLFGAITFGLRLCDLYLGLPIAEPVLSGDRLIVGLFTVVVFYIYPMEVISPKWLNPKKAIIMFAPLVVLCVIAVCCQSTFRELYSWNDIIYYINEPNVWFRLLILIMVFPYVLMILVVPHSWRNSSVGRYWIYLYTIIFVLTGVFHALFNITNSTITTVVYLIFFISVCLFICYKDLFSRIMIPNNPLPEPPLPKVDSDEEIVGSGHSPLWIRLNNLMKSEEPWRNPDITLSNLATKLLTNRTSLSSVIHENGFSSYKEYINRYRIDEFLRIVNLDDSISLHEAFFRVGYRSRMTALRYFQKFMKCTPSEYYREQKNAEK